MKAFAVNVNQDSGGGIPVYNGQSLDMDVYQLGQNARKEENDVFPTGKERLGSSNNDS